MYVGPLVAKESDDDLFPAFFSFSLSQSKERLFNLLRRLKPLPSKSEKNPFASASSFPLRIIKELFFFFPSEESVLVLFMMGQLGGHLLVSFLHLAFFRLRQTTSFSADIDFFVTH